MKSTDSNVVRFQKAISNNRFRLDELVKMTEILSEKLCLISVTDYAKSQNISQPAALKRVKKAEKVASLNIGGKLFVLDI